MINNADKLKHIDELRLDLIQLIKQETGLLVNVDVGLHPSHQRTEALVEAGAGIDKWEKVYLPPETEGQLDLVVSQSPSVNGRTTVYTYPDPRPAQP